MCWNRVAFLQLGIIIYMVEVHFVSSLFKRNTASISVHVASLDEAKIIWCVSVGFIRGASLFLRTAFMPANGSFTRTQKLPSRNKFPFSVCFNRK